MAKKKKGKKGGAAGKNSNNNNDSSKQTSNRTKPPPSHAAATSDNNSKADASDTMLVSPPALINEGCAVENSMAAAAMGGCCGVMESSSGVAQDLQRLLPGNATSIQASKSMEDELVDAFQSKCSVSPGKEGEIDKDNSNNNNDLDASKSSQQSKQHPSSSKSLPSYLRPTVSSAKKSPARSSPANSPGNASAGSPAHKAPTSVSPTAKTSPSRATGTPSSSKKSMASLTASSQKSPPTNSPPIKSGGPSVPPRSPPTAKEQLLPTSSPTKAGGNCCASQKKATPALVSENDKKPATKTALKNPPPLSSCCSSKKQPPATLEGAGAANNTTTTPPTTNAVCCGCGDNCRCCKENGWSYCQCGPSCRCSNPLMAEQASLILECTSPGRSRTPGNDKKTNNSSSNYATDAKGLDDVEAQINTTATNTSLFVDIVVGGMTCTMCSQALTNAMNAMKEVESVSVSLSTDVAHIQFDPQLASQYGRLVEQVEETITDIGYMVVDVMPMPNMKLSEGGASSSNRTPGTGNLDDGNTTGEINALPSSQQDRWDRIAQRQEEKLRKHKRAFLWSLVGTLPILLLTMVLPHVLPHANPAGKWWHRQHVHVFHKDVAVESLLLWFLATPVQFICGWDFYKSSYYGIFRTGTLGMDLLVVLGTTSSYGYALYATLTGQSQESHFFETSAVLICFVLLGKWMQALAVHRTSDALSHLMKLQPSTAIRVFPIAGVGNMGGSWDPMQEAYREETVPTNQLQQGDTVKIVPGASLPADGVVLAGELSVDESMVTGESLPVLKTKDSVVLGGTVCVESSISNSMEGDQGGQVAFCQVTGVGSSTALAQIIQLVQDAQSSKVPMQNFADTVSSIFVPVVATLSIITFLVWYALCSSDVVPEEWYTDLDEDAATFSLMFGIACLVISCPCALGLATPTAVMVGTGMGAKLGILMKGGEALEAASKVNSVVLDKTGTVTRGVPAVTDFLPLMVPTSSGGSCCSSKKQEKKKKKDAPKLSDGKPLSKETILWLLGSLERSSEHPLAKAIVAYAEKELSKKKKGSSFLEEKPFLQPSDFRSMTGRGAAGYLKTDNIDGSDTTHVALGNRAFFSSLDNELTEEIDDKMKALEEQGKTAILGAINNQFCVVLGVADELKSDAVATVAYLRNEMKIDVWMVTGDNARTAQAIASQLNLPPQRVVSEALPNAKVHQVKKLQQQGRIVAHVGDGINDSPALAQADVGISMGTGAAIAAEASDMVLVRGQNVADICTALDLSRVIFSRIKWNFMWSLIYNCLGIPLAAGVAFPIFHTRLPPTVAALAMAMSSISVVFSSLALRLYRPPSVVSSSAAREATSARQTSQPTTPSTINSQGVMAVTSLTLDGGDKASAELREPLLANDHLPADSEAMEGHRSNGKPS